MMKMMNDQEKAKSVLTKLAWEAPNEEAREWKFLRDLLKPIAAGTHVIVSLDELKQIMRTRPHKKQKKLDF